jgi:hypothetical protein
MNRTRSPTSRHGAGHRLLHHHVHAAVGGHPNERRVGPDGCRDVHGVRVLALEHLREVGVCRGDRELLGARLRLFRDGIADRDDLDVRHAFPAGKMKLADEPGARYGDLERPGSESGAMTHPATSSLASPATVKSPTDPPVIATSCVKVIGTPQAPVPAAG